MKTLKEQIAVMQAAEDGAEIEADDTAGWFIAPDPNWNWFAFDYRVANPKPREFWRNYYDDVIFTTIYISKEIADKAASAGRTECVHFREVLEDE